MENDGIHKLYKYKNILHCLVQQIDINWKYWATGNIKSIIVMECVCARVCARHSIAVYHNFFFHFALSEAIKMYRAWF